MLNKVKSLFSFFKIKPTCTTAVNPINNTVQEDPRQHETIRRVRKEFDKQEQAMNGKALAPHSADCKDPVTCTRKDCWKYIPNKVVGDSYLVDKATGRRIDAEAIKKDKAPEAQRTKAAGKKARRHKKQECSRSQEA